ncbi:MAG: T9SS type A sorting domain-containing protein [Saprospiraceae bacterium]|nr:T9SS type A sorting domain-containing protein [Saprospiraceae bacterium]
MVTTTLTAKFRNCPCRLTTSFVLVAICITCTVHSLCQPFPVDTIIWTGPASDRINLVFLSDGYQSSELEQYIQDVHQVADHFFRQSPFSIYRQYFNLIAIKVPSKASGAKTNPSDEHDTYFGSTFNYSGIERLLVAQKSFAAQEILFEQFPLFDQAVLIVNDQRYGGSGGWLATTSVHESAPEIALHEIGHSFAGLADEYWAGEQFAAEKPNMTQSLSREKVTWRNWLDYADVGVYLHEENQTWARPHQNCKMRVLNPEFCSVCQESLVKRIHDLTNPIIHYQPATATLDQQNDSIVFKVDFLETNPNSLQVQWYVNQIPYDSYNELVLYKDPAEVILQINMTVVDTTYLVRDPAHLGSHTYSLNWEIKSDSTTGSDDHLVNVRLFAFPNPASDWVRIELSTIQNQPIILMLRDMSGKLVYQISGYSGIYLIPVGQIPAGSYLVTVSGHQVLSSIPFIKQ